MGGKSLLVDPYLSLARQARIMADQESELDAYVNQIRNTIHAAHGASFEPRKIHERLEGLLFEFYENYDPRIESKEELETELEQVLRQSYLATDEVIEVLETKVSELEQIGTEMPEYETESAEE